MFYFTIDKKGNPFVRRFNHWSIPYITARLRDIIYQKRHPNHPWLTPQAIDFIDQWLKPEDKGLEFGSGKSTIWLAQRVSYLTSVENIPEWFHRVRKWLLKTELNNVNYVLAGEKDDDQTKAANYLLPALDISDESLDFIIVDGRWRDQCATLSISKLCPGGLMVIDNANLYLPCDSPAPNSQTIEEGPASAEWQKVWDTIKDWRTIWTTNGVFDTALFIKPPH